MKRSDADDWIETAEADHDRRQRAAREARDRLAALLDIAPSELCTLSPQVAARIVQRLEHAEQSALDASYDGLTGVLLRAPGQRAISAELARAARSGERLSMLFADVDGLKLINDRYGHLEGDSVLAGVGARLRRAIRLYDVAVRWGGDEFVVALPDCDLGLARRIAARIESDVSTYTRATITCGTAELLPQDDLQAGVCRADQDMYARKRSRERREAD